MLVMVETFSAAAAVICPSGNLAASLSRPSAKKIPLSPSGKSPLEARPSRARKEGRIAIVTDVGAGCDGRSSMRWTSAAWADGEVVWS
jgi:hypothetical protein